MKYRTEIFSKETSDGTLPKYRTVFLERDKLGAPWIPKDVANLFEVSFRLSCLFA